MLEAGDAGRDEDAEMADMRVGQVDDPLPGLLRSSVLCVDGRDPAERLVRRRDVVAVGGKDHERVADARRSTVQSSQMRSCALLELVADEQVLDDRDDLLAAQEVEAVPPALELEKALVLACRSW